MLCLELILSMQIAKNQKCLIPQIPHKNNRYFIQQWNELARSNQNNFNTQQLAAFYR